MKEQCINFHSPELELNLTLSTGEYDAYEDEEPLFYICISDEDDLCYQFSGLSYEIVSEVFDEIKDLVNEDNFYGDIYPNTCLKYGLFKELN